MRLRGFWALGTWGCLSAFWFPSLEPWKKQSPWEISSWHRKEMKVWCLVALDKMDFLLCWCRAHELDWMFMSLWRSVLYFFPISSSPTAHKTIFKQGTAGHNFYATIIFQSGTSIWEHLWREEYQDNTFSVSGEFSLEAMKDQSYFLFLFLLVDGTIVEFC